MQFQTETTVEPVSEVVAPVASVAIAPPISYDFGTLHRMHSCDLPTMNSPVEELPPCLVPPPDDSGDDESSLDSVEYGLLATLA